MDGAREVKKIEIAVVIINYTIIIIEYLLIPIVDMLNMKSGMGLKDAAFGVCGCFAIFYIVWDFIMSIIIFFNQNRLQLKCRTYLIIFLSTIALQVLTIPYGLYLFNYIQGVVHEIRNGK